MAAFSQQIAMQKKQEIEEEIRNKQESLESALATKNDGNTQEQKDQIATKQSQILKHYQANYAYFRGAKLMEALKQTAQDLQYSKIHKI